MPDIRQILRQSRMDELGADPSNTKPKHAQKDPPSERMNRQSQYWKWGHEVLNLNIESGRIESQVPSQMRHQQKCEASSDDSDEEGDAEESEEDTYIFIDVSAEEG